jgi:hypothetical protein
MLHELDEIDWAKLGHAYGEAANVPDLLRQAASEDGARAEEALSELHGSVLHQGTVYSATVAAVPFLVELARSAPTRRGEFTWMVGMLADSHWAHGADFIQVRAAVAERADGLLPLLADAQPDVRAAAAYALAQCDADPAPLWARWGVEEDPRVRASLLLALGGRDPGGCAAVAVSAVVSGAPAVRVAAALALLRSHASWPEGAVASVLSAIDDGAEVEYAWQHADEVIDELLVDADDGLAVALLEGMLASREARTRQAGVWGMTVRCQSRRSAPPRLLPLVRPLLDDVAVGVRTEVVKAFRRCGGAVIAFGDDVARVAARYPQTAGANGFTPEHRAVETLMLLSDPRWLDPVCEAAAAGADVQRLGPLRDGLPWNSVVFDALRGRLAELAGGPGHPVVPVLATALGGWGPAAVAAVPELLAALPRAGVAVSRAMLRMGRDELAAVPYLRAYVAETADADAALGVWRMVGDPEPLIGVLRALLTADQPWVTPAAHAAVSAAGGVLEPLMVDARPHLTEPAERDYTRRERQILAARLVWVVTGDPAPVLPTVRAVVAGGERPAIAAAGLLADLALSGADLTAVVPALRELLHAERAQPAAALALWRLGTPPPDLVAPLIAAIDNGWGGHEAVSLLVEMDAVEAVAELGRLAERDERVVTSGIDDDIVWQDEVQQTRLRAAVAALRRVR